MKNQDAQVEFEEPPGHRRPPHPWEDVPLPLEEVAGLSASGPLIMENTPYFASLMLPDDPNCLIRRQIVPTAHELVPFETKMADSLAEDAHSPVPGPVHYYPNRVLMLIATQCANDGMLPDGDVLTWLQWILKSLPKRPQAIPHNGPQREIHIPAILNMEGKQ